MTDIPIETTVAMPTRPLYWSVRRELWENRSIYLAPLFVAGVALFGFVISTIGMPHRRRATMLLPPPQQHATINRPYDVIAMMILATSFIVAIFYCLDALHGERRDRSILFWKSLPVSDRTTVLSKIMIPLAVLPSVVCMLFVATQIAMLVWTTIVLLPSGLAGTTFTSFNLLWQTSVLLYGLIVLALWHAPLYAWLLLVSGWAKRAAILWAVLPFAALAAIEKIAIGTTYFGQWVKSRLIGFAAGAFAFDPHGQLDSLSQLTPGKFLTSFGLWSGLVFAALCIAAAVRLRRTRGPV
jgi:ABC-2 type transport system permease protein